MPDDIPDDDPNRVNPAEHRGRDEGLLAKVFKLKAHRADDDITGPRPLPRDEGEADEGEDCEP